MHSKTVPATRPTRRNVPSIAVPDKYQAVITLKSGDKVFVSPPEMDPDKTLYTLCELVLRLEPYQGKGLKRK